MKTCSECGKEIFYLSKCGPCRFPVSARSKRQKLVKERLREAEKRIARRKKFLAVQGLIETRERYKSLGIKVIPRPKRKEPNTYRSKYEEWLPVKEELIEEWVAEDHFLDAPLISPSNIPYGMVQVWDEEMKRYVLAHQRGGRPNSYVIIPKYKKITKKAMEPEVVVPGEEEVVEEKTEEVEPETA